MKAAVLKDFDAPIEVVDINIVDPGEGEVRVRVHAASVNGFDVAVAGGMLKGVMEHRFPVVIGKDFAGTVEALGAGVRDLAIGDRVFGVVAKEGLGDGSFGEYVNVPADKGIARIPEGVTFVEASSLGLAGAAALSSFEASGLGEGQTVLIAGATGGVGQQAIQLAAKAGATVIATARTDDEVAVVRDLGAARTVDYTADIAAQLKDVEGRLDAVLHFAGNPSTLLSLVKPDGAFVSTIVMDPSQLQADQVRVIPIFAQTTNDVLERVADNHASEITRVTIQRVYSLDEAPDALKRFTQGTVGKLVLAIN